MNEKYVSTEQGKVHYWTSEKWDIKNDTLFFFPGLTADHSMFEKQVEYFKNKYNIIVWDAPCHGKSRPYNNFSFENTSNAILKIMQENNVENILAVGQSLGGYYVQAFMRRYSNKVKAFIGIGTTPYGDIYYSKSDIFWLRQVERFGMWCPEKWLKKMSSKQATVTANGYSNMMNMIEQYEKKEYCHLMQIAYDEFLKDNTNLEIKCPVLITYGEADKVGKVKQYCKMWHKQTSFPLIVIKNAGHNANVDNPTETNDIIDKFLQDLN